MEEIRTLVRGSTEPDLEITITDSRQNADFTGLTAGACRVLVEQDGVLIVDDTADDVDVAPDGKSAVVKRAWGFGETDVAGRCWVSVEVEWAPDRTQTFPDEGPLRLDIGRAPADP